MNDLLGVDVTCYACCSGTYHIYDNLVFGQTFSLQCVTVKGQAELPAPVQTVIEQEMGKIYGSKDPKTLNEEFLSTNSCSLQHLLAGELMQVVRLCDYIQQFTPPPKKIIYFTNKVTLPSLNTYKCNE